MSAARDAAVLLVTILLAFAPGGGALRPGSKEHTFHDATEEQLSLQQASAEESCAPAPPPSSKEDAEVEAALSNFGPPGSSTAAEEALAAGEGENGGGTSEEMAEDEAYNPHGFCPLKSKKERMKAAKDVGGGTFQYGKRFSEFNARLMASTRKPINPATDHSIQEKGPVRIKGSILGGLNGILPTWAGVRTVGFLIVGLPSFALGGGNRTTGFLADAVSGCWNPRPLVYGPQLFKYSEVLPLLTSPLQQRGFYTATITQHRDFFHPDSLLFLHGERHLKNRQLLELAGFARRYPVDVEAVRQIAAVEGCDLPKTEVFTKHVGLLVQKAIWGAAPTPEVEEALLTYGKYGKYGIFGAEIHKVLGPARIAAKIRDSKNVIRDWAIGTPFAAVFRKALNLKFGAHPWFLEEELLIDHLTVASLFAGLVGTIDMTTKCVQYQKRDASHQELFKKHPEKYLIELMRFDSAVTSVTDLIREETNYTLEGRKVTLKAGTPRQLVIATPNRDPMHWERPNEFDPDRSNEDMLSWNGRAEDVEARSLEKSPRHCPGHCLSLKVGAAICAAMMGSFEELLAAGKILKSEGEVKCNNFGDREEPELWTPDPNMQVAKPPEPFATSGDAKLLKKGHQCGSARLYLGKIPSLSWCVDRVKAAGGKFLTYGTSWIHKRSCRVEYTERSDCPEGFKKAGYDFYDIPSIDTANTNRGHANVLETSITKKMGWWKRWRKGKPHTLERGILTKQDLLEDGHVFIAHRHGKVKQGWFALRKKYCIRDYNLAVFEGNMAVETSESCCQSGIFRRGDCHPKNAVKLASRQAFKKNEPLNVCRKAGDSEFRLGGSSHPALDQHPSVGSCLSVNVVSKTLSMREILNTCPQMAKGAIYAVAKGAEAFWKRSVKRQLAKGGDVRKELSFFEWLVGKEEGSSRLDPVTFDTFTTGMVLTIVHFVGKLVDDSGKKASDRIPLPTTQQFTDRQAVYDYLGSPIMDIDFPGTEPVPFEVACWVDSIISLPADDDVVEGDSNSWQMLLGQKDGYPSSCPDSLPNCTRMQYIRGIFEAYKTKGGHEVYPAAKLHYAERWLVDGMWKDEAETALGWTFYGTHHIQVSAEEGTAFVIRTNVINRLSRRPGFGEHGADLYFNADGVPVMIETPKGIKLWRSKVDEQTWQYWKFVWRSSLFMYVTMIDHLWSTHFTAANVLTSTSREALPAKHPLRRLLTIFTFNTVQVNSNALHALVAPHSMLHRSSPFSDFMQVATIAQDSVPSLESRFGMFTSLDRMHQLPPKVQQTPYYMDGQVLFDHLQTLVGSWFDLFPEWCPGGILEDPDIKLLWTRVPSWSILNKKHFIGKDSEFLNFHAEDGEIRCDGFKLWLTIHLFHITGYHRHIGTVAEDAANPDWVASAFRPGERFSRPRQAILIASISAGTARTWPKISEEYGFIVEGMDKADAAKAVLADFRHNMDKMRELVDERNNHRTVPYRQMHPDEVEISVAV